MLFPEIDNEFVNFQLRLLITIKCQDFFFPSFQSHRWVIFFLSKIFISPPNFGVGFNFFFLRCQVSIDRSLWYIECIRSIVTLTAKSILSRCYKWLLYKHYQGPQPNSGARPDWTGPQRPGGSAGRGIQQDRVRVWDLALTLWDILAILVIVNNQLFLATVHLRHTS